MSCLYSLLVNHKKYAINDSNIIFHFLSFSPFLAKFLTHTDALTIPYTSTNFIQSLSSLNPLYLYILYTHALNFNICENKKKRIYPSNKKTKHAIISNIRWRPPPSGQVTRGFRMMYKSKRFYQEATLNAEHADKFHLLFFFFSWFSQLPLHYIFIYSDRTTINLHYTPTIII